MDWARSGASEGLQQYRARGPGAKMSMEVATLPLIPSGLRAQILGLLQSRSFVWAGNRHKGNPITDQEAFLYPWLDRLTGRLVRNRIAPSLARMFGVEESHLVMREHMVVKYDAENRFANPGVNPHVDQSCFSYVVLLNERSDFDGGGTQFDGLAPLNTEPGSSLLFSGRSQHAGANVTRGRRYIFTGFVDLRAPESVRLRVDSRIRAAGGRGCPAQRTFKRPYLRYNIDMLARLSGARGHALLRFLSNESSAALLPHADMRPHISRVQRWLRTGLHADAIGERLVKAVLDHESGADQERHAFRQVGRHTNYR